MIALDRFHRFGHQSRQLGFSLIRSPLHDAIESGLLPEGTKPEGRFR